jgi:hypothetical protein
MTRKSFGLMTRKLSVTESQRSCPIPGNFFTQETERRIGEFHQREVEILGVVDAVLDLLALAVELALFWPVARHVAIDMDLDHQGARKLSRMPCLSE